jgi:hypothetical protein
MSEQRYFLTYGTNPCDPWAALIKDEARLILEGVICIMVETKHYEAENPTDRGWEWDIPVPTFTEDDPRMAVAMRYLLIGKAAKLTKDILYG